MPEVMFNVTKDELALSVIDEVHRNERMHQQQQPIQAKPVGMPVTAGDSDKKKGINLALSQFQAHLLKKQIHLLDIQERNLLRESQKLDMELQILARKRFQQGSYEEGKQMY